MNQIFQLYKKIGNKIGKYVVMPNYSNGCRPYPQPFPLEGKGGCLVLILKILVQFNRLHQIVYSSVLLFLLPNISSLAQSGQPIEIIAPADSLVGISQNGMDLRKLIGHVSLRQGTTLLYSDLAIMNPITNVVEAYGRVKIIQSDTVTITGDSAIYFGSTRQAKITGKVLLDDRTVKLTTRQMDYNLNTRMAVYTTNGRIVDKDGQVITSKEGYYNTGTKIMLFKQKVVIVNQKDKFNLKSDSLRYSTTTKEAFFIAPTQIINKNDTVLVKAGVYNTRNKISNFLGRSTIRTEEYQITGDTLLSDTPTEIRIARGNVIFVSKKDKSILTGNYGKTVGKTGVTKIHGNALLRSWQGKDSLTVSKDTLFLSADTLIALENKELKTKKMLAYKKVMIYRKDMQAKCDSLSYNVSDSTIFFYQKPIIWNDGSQSEADSINLTMVENKPKIMNLKGKSFVIQQDTLKNFNQIKGRKIVVNFTDGKLDKVTVDGNGESIYYAIDEKNELTGMNRVQCSKMIMAFKKGKVKRITFISKPDAKFMPPKEIKEGVKFLDNFSWRDKEKPTKESTMACRICPKPAKIDSLKKPTVVPVLPVVKIDSLNLKKRLKR